MSESPTDKTTSPLIHLTEPAPAPKPAAAAPKAAPSAREYADMSPQQRFEHQQQEGDRVTGTHRGPERAPGVRVDEATWDRMTYPEKIQYAEQFNRPAATNADGSPADPAAPPVADPSSASIKISGVEKPEAEWLRAMSDMAARDVVRTALPSPDAYRAVLPADFTPPPGLAFKLNENDPLMAQARTAAHEMGLSQEQFSKLLGIYAGAQVGNDALVKAGRDAEIAKLGAMGPARVTAVIAGLKGIYGAEQGARMARRIFTANDVEDWERVISSRVSQGSGSFRASGREPPEVEGRVDEATYDAMSYGQKKEYAEKFTGPGNSRRGR